MVKKYYLIELTLLILAGFLVASLSLAASTDSVTATVLVSNVSVSLDQSSFDYGTMSTNTASSTLEMFGGSGIIATNDGNVTSDFDIYAADTAGWTLAGTTDPDQYIHKFCNDTDDDCASPPTNYTALTTSPQTFKASISTSGTASFQTEITTPTTDSTAAQQSASVTVQVSAS